MEDATGVDLGRFRLWYAQAGRRTVSARWSHDPVSRRLDLALSQTVPSTPGQPNKLPMPVPVRAALIGRNGAALPLRITGDDAEPATTARVLVLAGEAMTVPFEAVPPGAEPGTDACWEREGT